MRNERLVLTYCSSMCFIMEFRFEAMLYLGNKTWVTNLIWVTKIPMRTIFKCS